MESRHLFLIIMTLFLTHGCYADMTGTVVDAETGKPIENAVILVEWTITKGLGLTYTKSYKVVEALTDKNGKFSVEGVSNPLVNPPDLTIYKKGYVAWSSRIIFPDHRSRSDFKWQSGYVFKLERFDNNKYTYNDHTSFIHSAINLGSGEGKKLITDAYYWEEDEALKERKRNWEK